MRRGVCAKAVLRARPAGSHKPASRLPWDSPGRVSLHTLVFPLVLRVGNRSLRSTVTPSSFPTPPGSSSKGLEKETLASQDTSHPGWTAQDGIHPKEGSQEKSTSSSEEPPESTLLVGNQVKMSRTRRKGQPQRGTPPHPPGKDLSASRTQWY